jgi:hypothetical protein
MLGIIELGRGNLDEAEQLISAAMALRPPYAAILHNWQLVQDARYAVRERVPEQLAEPRCQILVDLALATRARKTVREQGRRRRRVRGTSVRPLDWPRSRRRSRRQLAAATPG